MHGLFIDNFCGGGGASTGIAAAIGRDVDVAVNHDQMAIAVHKANHPGTEHHCNDIRAVWPAAASRNRKVGGIWFSPDCKEFSKAKGGPVKDRSIRSLAWEIPAWIEQTEPDVVYVENVEEFQQWGPLEQREDGKWYVILDKKGQDFKRFIAMCRRQGYRIDWRELRACDYGAPTLRKRLYIVMRRDKRKIVWPKPTHAPANDNRVLTGELLPYRTAAECIDWSIECPSIFITRDEVRAQKLRIKRPLEDATLRRVAAGVMRHVVNDPQPFIVPVTHTGDTRTQPSTEPLRTITTTNGGEFMAADITLAPHITKFHSGSVGSDMRETMPTVTANGQPARPAGATPLGIVAGMLAPLQNGERRTGETPRSQSMQHPYSTIATGGKFAAITAAAVSLDRQFGNSRGASVARPMPATMAGGGGKTAQVSAFLSRFHKSNTNGGRGEAGEPLGAVTAGGQHHAVVAAHMEQVNTGRVGHPMEKPVSTITSSGSHQRLVETTLIAQEDLPPAMMQRAEMVAAFLVKYFGSEVGQHQRVDAPLHTVTTLPRFAVVTVTINAVTYVIVDIGLRMLTPRELARAQGFPDSYVLDPIVAKVKRGKVVYERLTKAEQIRMIGNSVCPDVARALVAANQPGVNDNWIGTVSEWRMAA